MSTQENDPLAPWRDLEFARRAARTTNGRPMIEAAKVRCEEFIAFAEKELARFVECHATIVEALKEPAP